MLATAAVQAQVKGNVRYKWHDGQGLMHFTDSLTADTMKYGYDVVNDQGLIIQHVPRQLTADERVAANQIAAEDAAKQRIEQDRTNNEAQMMAAYPDESAYKMFQLQGLDHHRGRIGADAAPGECERRARPLRMFAQWVQWRLRAIAANLWRAFL